MSEKQWVYSPFNNRWINEILKLRFQVFHQEDYAQGRWKWQYQDNPQGTAHVTLAVDKATQTVLAGHYALIAYKVKLGSDVVSMSQSVDTFTNPDFRNQNIFVELAKLDFDLAKKDGVEAVFGFPNTNSYHGFVKKLGFSDPFGLSFWVKPITAGILFKKLKLPAVIGKFFGRIPLFFKPTKLVKDFKEVKSLPQDWDDLRIRFEKNFPICISRDKSYMNWRYFNCPDRAYRFFEYRRNDQLLGFAVMTTTKDAYPTGQIVDLIVGDLSFYSDLIDLCVYKLKQLGAHTAVVYLHKENKVTPYFSRKKFSQRGIEVRFILKQLGALSRFTPFAFEASNWYLMGGDTDYL